MALATKVTGYPGLERALVQILVEVANIQVRTLKADVENGSM